ncbi:MAG: sigma-70 family RNA polymerase sigma factor [Candidatus Rokubacteria bacterium]|nr:sigma-70 family RNA polymerase sigma factor [Candidatus Rokubacteria bacterium]
MGETDDLVPGLRAGRREAFEALVDRTYRMIYGLAARMVGHPEEARDIVQEVYLRSYQALPRYRGEASPGTWLYRIAVNVCLDHQRRRRPREALDETLSATNPSPLEASLEAESARRLAGSVMGLPPRQKVTLVLRVYQGLSFREIAELLDSPIGTVKANYHHALLRLRQEFRGTPGS